MGVEVNYHAWAIIVRGAGRKLDSAKGRCYNAPSTRPERCVWESLRGNGNGLGEAV